MNPAVIAALVLFAGWIGTAALLVKAVNDGSRYYQQVVKLDLEWRLVRHERDALKECIRELERRKQELALALDSSEKQVEDLQCELRNIKKIVDPLVANSDKEE